MTSADDWLRRFDEVDATRTGVLTFEQFQSVYRPFNKVYGDAVVAALFRGLDLDGDELVSRDEVAQFAANADSEIGVLKILFRAFDVKRNGRLKKAEVVEFARVMGESVTEEEVTTRLGEIAGPNLKSVTFAQVAKFFKVGEVAPDVDPYDGLQSAAKKLLKAKKKLLKAKKKAKKREKMQKATEHAAGEQEVGGEANESKPNQNDEANEGEPDQDDEANEEDIESEEEEEAGQPVAQPEPVAQPVQPEEQHSKCCLLL